MTFAKRDLLATCSLYSGFTSLLGLLPAKPSLLVLNHHRIGNADETPYDPEVFSGTAEQLDARVRFLKQRFPIATLDEALEIVEGGRCPHGTVVLLTFDDGYLDNYESAYPVLASHGVSGIFFLPTAFIGTNCISWWDTIAYIIKQSRHRQFRLGSPPFPTFDLDAMGERKVIARVLDIYRSGPGIAQNSEPFISMLEEVCGTARPDGTQRCFMNWEEAADLSRHGMAVGSHAHSHEILARLSDADQLAELTISKHTLEERLGSPIHAISYPVGLTESFSSATRTAAAQAGYRIGFSFYGGFNRFGAMDRYDVRRQGGASNHRARFHLQMNLARATAGYWF